MLTYLYQLKRTPQENSEGRRSLYRQIEELRQTIEKGPLLSWDEDAKLHYAGELTAIWAEYGMDEDQAIRLAAQTLSIPEEKISAQWKDKAPDEPEAPARLAPTPVATNEQFSQMLLRFHSLPLERKSMAYFDGGLAAGAQQYTTALVLLEVFRTLYHLSNFGDKLLFGETLDEDHCTQLFREMFNLNGGEWWRLAANDQQQSGSTGKVSKKQLHRSAENDLLIKADNYTCMILEAMVLTSWDQSGVERHLLKLIGDNIHNAPMVLLVYGNSTAPLTLWKQLTEYLLDSFPVTAEKQGVSLSPFTAFSDSEFHLPDPYTPLRELTRHSLVAHVQHGGMEAQPLVVICADIGKRAHTGVSFAARNGGQP